MARRRATAESDWIVDDNSSADSDYVPTPRRTRQKASSVASSTPPSKPARPVKVRSSAKKLKGPETHTTPQKVSRILLRQHHDELYPPIPDYPSNRAANRVHGLFYNIVFGTLEMIFFIIGTVLNILKYPVVIAISLGIVYYVGYSLFMAAIPNVCKLPGISMLEYCQDDLNFLPLKPPKLDSRIQQGLDYNSKLEEMQKLGADSMELPYHLRIGEGAVRGMIIQLSAVDVPSKEKLMPLYREYSDLADQSIDGLQDWLSRIDQVVDNTILINSWAEKELEKIEQADNSMMAPIRSIAHRFLGPKLGIMTSEDEVREAFFGLTEKIQIQSAKVVVDAQRQRGRLIELKAILESIAIAALGDKDMLHKEKMNQASYWRYVLASHREKMMDFDAKMEMCALFYKHTEDALTVISTTQIKLQQMRGQLIVFRDGLSDAPLMLESGKKVRLRLYIDSLKNSVEHLEETRKSTKLIKAEKMRRLEEDLRDTS